MDRDFYNFVNANVNKNKEIQKLTGVSPTKFAHELKNMPPRIDVLSFTPPKIIKGTFFKVMLRGLYWKVALFCARMEAIKTSEYKRGYAEGRDFEFRQALAGEERKRNAKPKPTDTGYYKGLID